MRENKCAQWCIPQEALLCVKYAQYLVESAGLTCNDIDVITPHAAQVSNIRQRFERFRTWRQHGGFDRVIPIPRTLGRTHVDGAFRTSLYRKQHAVFLAS